MRTLLIIAMLTLVGCVGCGMPLYPKVGIQVDPATGRVAYQSQMETDLVIGQIEASVSPDGVKTLKVGTTTQPALTYGASAVGVMQEYANQQEKYTQMLDVIGKNAIGQIEAIGNAGGQILGGLVGLKSAGQALGGVGGGAITSACDALIPQIQDIMAKANAAKTVLAQAQAGK